MKKPTITQLSSLAVLPCLMSLAQEASAAIECSPTALVSGDTVALEGHCLDTATGLALSSGSEVWNIDASGSTSPVGSRAIPGGGLAVPALPGEHTYYISAIDTGYGGLVSLGGEGGYPGVTVNLPCIASPVAVGSAPTRRLAQRARPQSHDCAASTVASELATPLMALQQQRLRSNLEQAQSRMRSLRAGRNLPGLEIQGVPLPAQEKAVAPREQRLGVYVLGLGDYLRQNGSDTQAEFKLRSTALSVGADYRLNDAWVVGGNLGGSHARIDFAGTGSEQKTRGRQLTVYASWSFVPEAYLSATLSHEATRYDLRRDDGNGGFAQAAPGGRGTGLSLALGRDFSLGAWSVGPYVRLDTVRSRVDAFEESGSDAALAVGAQRVQSTTYNLGAQTQLSVPVSWGIVLPYLRVELTRRSDRHQDAPGATLINGNTTVLIPNNADSRASYGNVAVGVSGLQQGGVSWFADYETGVAQQGYRSRRIGAGLRFEL